MAKKKTTSKKKGSYKKKNKTTFQKITMNVKHNPNKDYDEIEYGKIYK